jgi:hypothetical protein
MSLQWYDFVGLAGVGFVLVSFFLLQAGKLAGDSLGYQLANLFGAIFILVSIFGSDAEFKDVISATVMQLAWIAISLFGLWRGVSSRVARFRKPRDPSQS